MNLRRLYDVARTAKKQKVREESEFDHDYKAQDQGTYTYNSRTGSFNNRAQSQQPFDEWKRTQKNDDNYNFFYKDARNEWHQNTADSKRGDQYQTGSSKFKQKGPRTYEDVYGKNPFGTSPPQQVHFRLGYLLAGLILANIFIGVLTGRGKDRDFYSVDDSKMHHHLQGLRKTNQDSLLSMYHNQAQAVSGKMEQS